MTAQTSPTPIQVFLSYAREDFEAISQLYDRLAEVGLKPWMDKADLLPGEQWRESILRAVRQSQFFLACVSTRAVDKRGFLQREFKLAADTWQEKLADDIYLIPVRFDDCEMPEALRAFQWVNFYEPDGWARLLRGLRAGIERQGLPAPDRLMVELAALGTAKRNPVALARTAAEDVLTITTPVRMELVRVPAGKFLMGSNPAKDSSAHNHEQPQHPVYLDEFYIGKYPVTNSQYSVFVKATQHEAPGHWENGMIPSGAEKHPVVNVNWYDAVAFCLWLEKATDKLFRLPSNAEWEKAAGWDDKTTEKRIWPWGDTFDAAKCNSSEGKKGGTTAVGAFSPAGDSPCGACDMAGNVWEWCETIWRKDYSAPSDDHHTESSATRVTRGGSYRAKASNVRCALDHAAPPDDRYREVGFRVVVMFP